RGSEQFFGAAWPSQLADHPAMLAGLIIFLIVVGLSLTVLFLYINSVMRFILFDSIVAKQCHIRQGWVRRRYHGLRFFVWQLSLMLISFAAFVLLIGIPLAFAWAVGWFDHPGEHLLPLVLGGIALLLLFLALAAGIAIAIITVIVFLVLLIPVGGVGVVAVLGGKAAGLTWNVYTISLAVVVGCIVLAVFIFAVALISVPAIVFFPAYSIYFLAARYPALAALLWPPPPDSVAPASPPPEAPPLPPAPATLG